MTEKEKNQLERLAIQIQKECEKEGEPVSWAESLEMAEMELKSKKECKQYVSDKTQKRKSAKERKIDIDKKFLIDLLVTCFNNANIEITNIQTETKISFNYNSNQYTLMLTKHRKEKSDK